MTLQPLTAATVPLHFMADYCLRCGTMFADGQYCHIVAGGPAAKYHQIGLCIDEACLEDPAFDVPVALTLYKCVQPGPTPTGLWPRYCGSALSLKGFAKVMMLDNGLAFVGLHRGHVEPWSRHEVRTIGAVYGSFAEGYGMVGPPGLFYHQVIDVRFYNLATPIVPARAAVGTVANAYIRGKRVQVPRFEARTTREGAPDA
jgi:hypothetical protein